MANRTVRLFRRVKTKNGWGHYPAVIAANGRVKPGWVTMAGKDVEALKGYYELRYYVGSRMIYERLSTDSAKAWNECKRKELELTARVVAREAGLKVADDAGRLSLAAELDRFVQAAEDRGASVAARVYRYACNEFLLLVNKTYADELTAEDLLRYRRELRKRVAARTLSNRHAHVIAFMRWCGLDAKALSPIRPRYEKTIPESYTSEEMRRLFASISDAKLHNTYSILWQAGLREQEATYLPWDNVRFDSGVIQVRSQSSYGFAIKDKEERDIPISAGLLARLRAYREQHPDERLVTGTSKDKPNKKLLRTLKRLVHNSGLACGVCEGCRRPSHECEHWYLHKFRATAITTWHRAGMDMRTIMRLSGHSDLETVMKYLAPQGNDAIRQQVDAIEWA